MTSAEPPSPSDEAPGAGPDAVTGPDGAAAPDARPSRALVLSVVGVLAVLLAVLATVLLWPEEKPAALPPPAPTATPSPTPTPTPTPTREVPYPHFVVGACFDHPQLSRAITKPEARPCEGEHDGESFAVLQLPEGLTGDAQIGRAMREGCKEPMAAAQARQGGGTWYGYPMGPAMTWYQQGWRDYSCTLTASNRQGGTKLTGHVR
ncbi:hypothetical protein ACWEQL_15370 [Kitasatospora sp. NPDC004240]